MNIYEMYVEHWSQPGFWVRRTTWGNTIAKVVKVGELKGRPPYYGNPVIIVVVYDLHSGEVKDDCFAIDTAGTYKTWRWVDPPAWSEDKPFDPTTGRVILNISLAGLRHAKRIGAKKSDLLDAWWIAEGNEKALSKAKSLGFLEPIDPNKDSLAGLVFLNVPFSENKTASRIGARWLDSHRSWWIAEDDEKTLAKAKELGYLEPIGPKAYFKGSIDQKQVAKDAGATWERDKRLWSLPVANKESITTMRDAGYQEVQID